MSLAGIEPRLCTLAAGSHVAHLYYTSSADPLAWNEFREVGPLGFRWDHHLPAAASEPTAMPRAVYYAAPNAITCLADVFHATRRIDRVHQAPWLVIFKTLRSIQLLDLSGDHASTVGASPAIHAAHRGTVRGWARDLYEAHPAMEGILYSVPSHAMAPAFAFNERTLREPWFPPHPEFHRSLADDLLLDPLKHAALTLGYALR